MAEYTECYVAFLDILGFKNLIKKSHCDDIYSIFDELNSKSEGSMKYNGIQIEAYKNIGHTILSDSIIIYIQANIDDSFPALLDICNRLQTSLAKRNIPILLRGGITKGSLYFKDNIIYGEGLTKAYLLESNLAKFPRIIFSGETLEDGKSNAKYMFPELEQFNFDFNKDSDGFYYVNYLSVEGFLNTTAQIKYFDNLKNLCYSMLNQEIELTLREKYLWIDKHIDKEIEKWPELKNFYNQREEEKSRLDMQILNEKYKIYETNK